MFSATRFAPEKPYPEWPVALLHQGIVTGGNMITKAELQKKYHYDPDTGMFARKTSLNKKIKKGYLAGTRSKRNTIDINIKGKAVKAHRLAWLYMTGDWPSQQIDHINGVPTDNRWINLREVSNQENSKNRRITRSSSSGVIGVHFDKNRGKWLAHIGVDFKFKYLGRYENKSDAIAARKEAEIKYGFHENHGRKH